MVAGPIPDITKWISTPGLSLEVGCQNETENGDACTCAPSVYATATPFDVLADWTTLPASSLRDTNAYRRMFSAEGKTLASTLQIWDAAGNKSPSPFISIPVIGIDRTAPVVAVTDIAGTGTTRTITLSAADSLSGIWTTTQSSGETIFVQT